MTRKEWQEAWGVSDETMQRIDLVLKLFHGKKIKHIDTYKGLPINERTPKDFKINGKNNESKRS